MIVSIILSNPSVMKLVISRGRASSGDKKKLLNGKVKSIVRRINEDIVIKIKQTVKELQKIVVMVPAAMFPKALDPS